LYYFSTCTNCLELNSDASPPWRPTKNRWSPELSEYFANFLPQLLTSFVIFFFKGAALGPSNSFTVLYVHFCHVLQKHFKPLFID
jgi:hypothetical protein